MSTTVLPTMNHNKISYTKNPKNIKNKNVPKISPTPYCATCHKIGLPVSEYTSHWTKSSPGPEGVVVCPTILNAECGYCHEKGHWTKFCKKLENRVPIHKKAEKINNPEVNEEDNEEHDFRPPSPNYPPPPEFISDKINMKKSYLEMMLLNVLTNPATVVPSKPSVRKNLKHNWADDEYWSSDNEEY
jgi:hypothetical protein